MESDQEKLGRIAADVMFPMLDRLDRHLPSTFDLTLSTLKGHLLIEEQLDNLIAARLPNPSALEGERLSFDLKIKLARALTREDHPEVWLALRKLNKLRNSLAHKLEDSKAQGLLEEFVKATESTGYVDRFDLSLEDRFGVCIYWQVSYLHHLAVRRNAEP